MCVCLRVVLAKRVVMMSYSIPPEVKAIVLEAMEKNRPRCPLHP